MIADEEGQKVGPVDQDLEVVDQRLAVEEVVGRDQKVPERNRHWAKLSWSSLAIFSLGIKNQFQFSSLIACTANKKILHPVCESV